MSHLHFVSTKEYYNRVIQLGEQPWRVALSGAPSLDSLNEIKLWPRKKVEEKINLSLKRPTILATLHPVTLQYEDTFAHVESFLKALEHLKIQVVFTYPNSDTSGRIIIDKIEEFVEKYNWASSVTNFGQAGYFSMLKYAKAMVGNSSSGIIESASFQIPVVNIGDRQRGRVKSFNVIDVDYDKNEIIKAINKALSSDFNNSLIGMKNPYGDGNASQKIIDTISNISIDKKLIMKKLYNLDN